MVEDYRRFVEMTVWVPEHDLDEVKNLITDAEDGAFGSVEDVTDALVDDGFEVVGFDISEV